MTEDPEIGDLVHLNSGSPPLTVTELYDDNTVEVSWIDMNLRPQSAIYPLACLKALPGDIPQ